MTTEKSVAAKARVKPGTTVAVLNRVPGIVESLGLPEDVVFVEPTEAQLVLLFVNSRAELETQMPPAVAGLALKAALWVFYRKGSNRLLKNEASATGVHSAAPCVVLSRARSAATSAPCVLALRVPSALPRRGVILQQPPTAAGLDMNRDSIWAIAESMDMRPLGLVGIDDTWSAFRLRRAATPDSPIDTEPGER